MIQDLSFRMAVAAVLGLVAAAGNVIGGYFVVRREWPRKYLQYFIALGAGYMLSVAFVDVIPGQEKRQAVRAAGLLGAATLAGVLLTSQLQTQLKYALPLAGGVTVYVAATDLLPEVNREPNWRMALLVFAGVASLLILRVLFKL